MLSEVFYHLHPPGSLTTAHKPQNSSYVAFCNFLCNFVIFGYAKTPKLQNGILLRPNRHGDRVVAVAWVVAGVG